MRYNDREWGIEAEAGCAYRIVIEQSDRWHPELEPLIAKSPKYACMYAMYVLRGRFLAAEAVIATDPEWAYFYARDVIRFPWRAAEHVILRDPYFAERYRIDVVQRSIHGLYFDDLHGGYFDNFYSKKPKPQVKVDWAVEGF